MTCKVGSMSYFDKMTNSAFKYVRRANAKSFFNVYSFATGLVGTNISAEGAIAEIKRLRPSTLAADSSELSAAVSEAIKACGKDGEVSVFVASDFTPKAIEQLSRAKSFLGVDKLHYELINAGGVINNVAIIDAQVIDIEKNTVNLAVFVKNYTSLEQSRMLRVVVNKRKSLPVSVELSPGQRKLCRISLELDESGDEEVFLQAEISLSPNDDLAVDDTYYLGFSVRRLCLRRVLIVSSEPKQSFLLSTAMKIIVKKDCDSDDVVKTISYSQLNEQQLNGTDVVIFSSITPEIKRVQSRLKKFVSAGGRVIYFVAEAIDYDTAKSLYEDDLLAALPHKYIAQKTRMKSQSSVSDSVAVVQGDKELLRSLGGYRLDRILLRGYYALAGGDESICIWEMADDSGLVYLKSLGSGSSVLVNTSIDDSLGALTKSTASVAFSRFLLGSASRTSRYCFEGAEQIVLPASSMEIEFADEQQKLQLLGQDGKEYEAAIAGAQIIAEPPGKIGWIRTQSQPLRYAGINVTKGETNMAGTDEQDVAVMLNELFPKRQGAQSAVLSAQQVQKQHKPIWKWFAWIVIFLVLVDSAVTNRMKR